MAESFMQKIASALATTVQKKQDKILEELELAPGGAKPGAAATPASTPAGTPPSGSGSSSASSGEMGNISQAKAIKLQADVGELSGLSGAATGIINSEKTAIQSIARNI